MNGYRLQEVSERGGVVRETYTRGEGWDANGAPVAEPEPATFTEGHPVLVVERKRRVMVGHVDNGRALLAVALASICKVPK